MRFTVFLALTIAAFVVCVSFTSAENAALPELGRNLRAQQAVVAKVDEIVSNVVKRDEIASNFLQALRKNGIEAKAKRLDNQAKILRDTADPISRLTKAEKAKMTEMFAKVAKTDPKTWSGMKKALVAILGVTVAGSLIYGVNKMVTTTAAPATGATGSQ